MCALIIATFSAFFPLKVILWWEKYKDSSSTLKNDSLSELYSPTQSMSLYSWFIWEFSIFTLWVREPPQVFIIPLLWTCTFTCSRTRCATNRVRGVASILFRMASRQTATIATSCSIWPHEILAFTTSAFPSFYSSYILPHFQVFTMQSHAPQLTALCAEAVMWVTLPVSYFHFRLFLSWRRWGEGQMFLCRYLWRVMH